MENVAHNPQYSLTEEQSLLREIVRDVARDRVGPGAAERDQAGEFSWEMVELLRECEIMGPDFPEEYGGGAGTLALAVIVEELSAADASVGLLPAVQELGSLPIMLAGNEAQKAKYLPALASGEKLAAFGLTETNSGTDVAGLRTKAVRDGDEYVLSGSKIFISNGTVADIHTVYAVTDSDAPSHKRGSMFIVEKETPGFEIGKHESKLGIRSSDTSELLFNNCRVPAANRLSEEGQGFAVVMKTLDFSRPIIAAQAVGIAQGAFDYALAYAKEREAFGKPITAFQGIGFKLAEMATRIEAARQLLYKTCAVLQTEPKDMSRLNPEVVRLASMAKTFAADVAMWVTTEAVQVLGGHGYLTDHPVERMMRDAKITQIYEGTNEIQRLVIANTL